MFRWGKMISHWPKVTILCSLLVCGVFTGGMLLWYQELDEEVLWTPYNSPVRWSAVNLLTQPHIVFQFIEQKAWIAENFPKDRRFENLILESDNVLTADTVKYVKEIFSNILRLASIYFIQFLKIDESLREFVSSSNYTLDDLCLRLEEKVWYSAQHEHLSSFLLETQIWSLAEERVSPWAY